MQAQNFREATMDKIELFSDPLAGITQPTLKLDRTFSSSKGPIRDPRVAQLLGVLHELSEFVAGVEELPNAELSDLISGAILACGFVNQNEARYAIAAVLETMEGGDRISEAS
jgi:hypothetical protein